MQQIRLYLTFQFKFYFTPKQLINQTFGEFLIKQTKLFNFIMERENYLPVQNNLDQHGWTNNVLILQNQKAIDLFLPCYMRTKLKNIVSLDQSTGIGLINIVIIFSIYYDKINQFFPGILQTLENSIVLRFKIDPPIKLYGGFITYIDRDGQQRSNYITKKVDQKQKLITFSIRRMLSVPLISYVFWSPFQYIKYVASINIDSINYDEYFKKIKISFNLMDLKKQFDRFSVVSYTDEGALGEYDLAGSKIDAQFTNVSYYSKDIQQQLKNRIKDKIKQKITHNDKQIKVSSIKIQPFKFGHSVYPVFRRPLVPLFNLFFPIVLLGLINLGIFFQDHLLVSKKIINIAALLVSYLYFLPIMRQKIPPSSSLAISQIVLFSMGSLTLLTFVHSVWYHDAKQFEFVWNQSIIYKAALILTLLIISVLSVVSLVFAFVFLPTYNSNKKRKQQKFDRSNWSNKQCDEYFNKLRQEFGYKLVNNGEYIPQNPLHVDKYKKNTHN